MIIAVDFDGTITKKNEYPNIGEINVELVNILKSVKEKGHELILWTCRSDEDLNEAVEICRSLGLEFDAINDHLPRIIEKGWGRSPKVYADIYFDDKSSFNVDDLRRLLHE